MLSGRLRFLNTQFRRPARPHVPSREIEHSAAIPCLGHPNDCSAARLFDIVGMCGNRQKIERRKIVKHVVHGRKSGVIVAAPREGKQAHEKNAREKPSYMAKPAPPPRTAKLPRRKQTTHKLNKKPVSEH